MAAGLTDADMSLKWLDLSDGQFKDAYLGNSDGGAQHQFFAGQYTGGAEFQLGNYGVDPVNHTVWAVLDHNSEFVAATAAPEPGAVAFLLTGFSALLGLRRVRPRV